MAAITISSLILIILQGMIMATIRKQLSRAELEARFKTADDAIAKSHFHALWCCYLQDKRLMRLRSWYLSLRDGCIR